MRKVMLLRGWFGGVCIIYSFIIPRQISTYSCCAGEIKGLGGYGQYCLADERISFKIPSAISREHASTVPLASATAWLALFSKSCLAIDRSSGTTMLVWGGSCKPHLLSLSLTNMIDVNANDSKRWPLHHPTRHNRRSKRSNNMQSQARRFGPLLRRQTCL